MLVVVPKFIPDLRYVHEGGFDFLPQTISDSNDDDDLTNRIGQRKY